MGAAEERGREAFEQLYRETRVDLLGYLVRRAETAEDAADILAETYLVAWRKLEEIPDGQGARPWLFAVSRNLLLKGIDRRRSRTALIERLVSELETLRPQWGDPLGDREDAVRAALATLPDLDREVLTLNAWEGLSPTEIGIVVGRSANSIRVRLHRARRRLRQQLDDTSGEDGCPAALRADPEGQGQRGCGVQRGWSTRSPRSVQMGSQSRVRP
jgi:RNA polymerase sigma factor (sigma-70 family)